MKKKQCLNIDGIIVDQNYPFQIYEAFPRTQSRKSCVGNKKSKQDSNLKDFAKNLFQQNIQQDCQDIHQIILHYRSVSSLRDCTLFSPPNNNTNCSAKSQQTAISSEVKKTIFANQFTCFEYISQDQ